MIVVHISPQVNVNMGGKSYIITAIHMPCSLGPMFTFDVKTKEVFMINGQEPKITEKLKNKNNIPTNLANNVVTVVTPHV